MPVMTWAERIDAAEQRSAFSEQDRDLAAEWVTCACGEQDPRLPRLYGYVPKDMELRDLGGAFCAAVNEDKFGKARTCLARIEQRAAEILAAA